MSLWKVENQSRRQLYLIKLSPSPFFFLCITYTKLDVDGNEILGNKKCQRIQIYRDNIIIIQGKKQSLCYPDNTLLFDWTNKQCNCGFVFLHTCIKSEEPLNYLALLSLNFSISPINCKINRFYQVN